MHYHNFTIMSPSLKYHIFHHRNDVTAEMMFVEYMSTKD